MARKSKLSTTDKYIIRSVVDKYHVDTLSHVIEADIKRRMKTTEVTPGFMKQALDYAVTRHNDNRMLFRRLGFI